MSTKLPTFIQAQLDADGILDLHSDVLYEEKSPFSFRLTDIAFREEEGKSEVLLDMTLYCRYWKSSMEISAFGDTDLADKGHLWDETKIRLRSWFPKSRFDEETIAYFQSIRTYWDGLEKIVFQRDCPWYVAGTSPVRLKVISHGGMWRVAGIDFGDGRYCGKGTKAPIVDASQDISAPVKPRIAFAPVGKVVSQGSVEVAGPARTDEVPF